jgi:hypothetical protein
MLRLAWKRANEKTFRKWPLRSWNQQENWSHKNWSISSFRSPPPPFPPVSMLPKCGLEVMTSSSNPRMRDLEFTRNIYSDVIWELLILKQSFIWSYKLIFVTSNFISLSLIRGFQDTVSEGFAFQPTSFQLYIYMCVCVCARVCTLMPE